MSLVLCPAMPGTLQCCPACAMAVAPRPWGWLDFCQVAHGLSRAPWAPWAPRLSVPTAGPALHGELSRNGSSQGCWRLIPRQIYHWGSQGADSPCSGAKLQRSRQGQQPQQGQARHEGCSHEQAAAAPGSVTKATARAHIWCFLGCSVLITLHIPPRREEMTALGDKGSASELQMETQMVACPGSTGSWHKGNQRGGPMRVFVAWTPTLPA